MGPGFESQRDHLIKFGYELIGKETRVSLMLARVFLFGYVKLNIDRFNFLG